MKIEEVKQLLKDISKLPEVPKAEATIFSIGGRGHYENPITDILAFFCHSEGEHGLGNLVVNALFDALPAEVTTHDTAVISEPQREVVTAKNKRLDLLLEGNDWVMVIENKIWHQQNNPFKTYEDYITTKQHFNNKKYQFFIVLSPKGETPPDNATGKTWHGLSYPSFLNSLKQQLSQNFINQPLNK